MHFLRLLALCWPGPQSAWDNHVLACNFAKYSSILFFFSDRLSNKPFWVWLLTTLPHLKYVVTLHTHTHAHTHLTALCPGLPRWAGTRKVKPIWILLEQETISGSGISWAICKSAPRSKQITTPAPDYSSFLQAGCPSCRPTNSVKALKAKLHYLAINR